MNGKITSITFVALLFTMAIANALTPSKSYSDNENRFLQQFPRFSLSSLLRGDFTEEFESYTVDQFFWRDGWVGVKTLSEKLSGKRGSSGVYFGNGGYLIEMFSQIDQEQYRKNLGYIEKFTEKIQESTDIDIHTVLVPTASAVLKDKLPTYAPEVEQDALLQQAETQIPGFVPVADTLRQHSGEYIYYRTDHHWTSLGAFYAYCQWKESTGRLSPSIQQYTVKPLSDAFYGTTYTKARLYTVTPDTIYGFQPLDLDFVSVDYNGGQQRSDSYYAWNYLEKKDKYSVFLGTNQPIVHISTQRGNGEKLLVIKDSYANSFLQMALTDYSEIYVIDPRYYRESIYLLAVEKQVDEILILYNLQGFSADTSLYFLTV